MYISNMYYKKITATLMAVSNHPYKSHPQVQPHPYQHCWALRHNLNCGNQLGYYWCFISYYNALQLQLVQPAPLPFYPEKFLLESGGAHSCSQHTSYANQAPV